MTQDTLRISSELLKQARQHMDASEYQKGHDTALEGVCATPIVPVSNELFELLIGFFAILGCSYFLADQSDQCSHEKGVDYFYKITDFALQLPEPQASHWCAIGRFNLGLVRLQFQVNDPRAQQSPASLLRSAATYFRHGNEDDMALLAEAVAETGDLLSLRVLYQ